MRGVPEPGEAFAGHLIEAEVGRGGMGIVFRARNVALDRTRAIKVVAPELSADPAFAARFRREARLAASVEHPNVITVHHAGEEDGLLYIVMRFVDGVDLARLIADGPLPPERALEILRPAAAALDAAHAGGLVHRDVKPANVLIEDGAPAGNRARLLTTRISKPMSGSALHRTATKTDRGARSSAQKTSLAEAVEGGVVARAPTCILALVYHSGGATLRARSELQTLIHKKASAGRDGGDHRLQVGWTGHSEGWRSIRGSAGSGGALVEARGELLAAGPAPRRPGTASGTR